MNLTSAAASLECQSALVEGPAAARAALAKHGASIASELALALEKVGSYTRIERGRTSLYGALINGDAATVEAIIVAGARLIDIKSNGVTPLDLATDDTCREILDNHAAQSLKTLTRSSLLVWLTVLIYRHLRSLRLYLRSFCLWRRRPCVHIILTQLSSGPQLLLVLR